MFEDESQFLYVSYHDVCIISHCCILFSTSEIAIECFLIRKHHWESTLMAGSLFYMQVYVEKCKKYPGN